ncbi:MAG TPA: sugar phosphate isomerase/epimerase family protein [Polyangiaceae bacterium]|nr:sugar phosphate isomerase/epimerase family protein [Polyangiaceae bacterium]
MSEPEPLRDLARLCVHTITTQPWSLDEAADAYARAGVQGITVWRDALAGRDVARSGELLRSRGLTIVSLCRGGFFPYADRAGQLQAHEDNRLAIDQAAALGAPLVVLVCGALPGQSLARSRDQIREGIEALLPHAEANQIRLAIEPLHPMYADSRSAINTLSQANDLALAIGSDYVGVAVDVYHLWWDPALHGEIQRVGRAGKLFAYHVCDWKAPTEDLLLDRGLPGEGIIPLRQIRGWVEAAGFRGFHEVEIFSRLHWATDQAAFLERIVQSYRDHV